MSVGEGHCALSRLPNINVTYRLPAKPKVESLNLVPQAALSCLCVCVRLFVHARVWSDNQFCDFLFFFFLVAVLFLCGSRLVFAIAH